MSDSLIHVFLSLFPPGEWPSDRHSGGRYGLLLGSWAGVGSFASLRYLPPAPKGLANQWPSDFLSFGMPGLRFADLSAYLGRPMSGNRPGNDPHLDSAT